MRGSCHQDVTRVVILGTDHSPQLVAETYQPAIFRAFFRRVQPDAICIEHPPEEYARGDFRYGQYAYEKHHIALPWAREQRIPVYPIDWLPTADDQALVWGVKDLEATPFIRQDGTYSQFLSFREEQLGLELFFAETEAVTRRIAEWYDQGRQAGERDFPRRLGLYRTFMQAMRIKAAARRHRGGTIVVVIGYFHKGDIEGVLGGDTDFEIVQPSSFGHPTLEEIEESVRPEDLHAVLSFNLLGVQARTGLVNWAWMNRGIERLESTVLSPEIALFRTRFELLTGQSSSEEAISRYEQLYMASGSSRHFSFDGVEDRSRIDSYYDPFGNLTVSERAMVETARERSRVGHHEEAVELRRQVMRTERFSVLQRIQLEAYWDEHVLRSR
jgi:hypothetical protein